MREKDGKKIVNFLTAKQPNCSYKNNSQLSFCYTFKTTQVSAQTELREGHYIIIIYHNLETDLKPFSERR